MRNGLIRLWTILILLPAVARADSYEYEPAHVTLPAPPREFRAAWLATVGNIDWPSKPGLPVAQQRAELTALLDRAVDLRLNAIIFQVRPACDAMYASSYEPWSEYITGVMGQAPQPLYDPLALAVQEAHRRGLELHAWFNPFRAHHSQAKSPISYDHVSRTHPEWVRRYGDEMYLDPGDPAVREYVRGVIMDVVRRYDVDGVQFDDYFYPYPVKDAAKQDIDFPDAATWQRYGGGADRGNWRRQCIDSFVHGVYTNIKFAKPWVEFGISPFGIWRPLNPPSVRGFDAYAKIYADSRLWLASGWVDYLSPQLYWPVSSPQQGFPALLQWWQSQNTAHRHVWPGLADYRYQPDEIARQIDVTRDRNAGGEIHFHLRNLLDNHGLSDSIRSDYPETALVPTSPWLDAEPPEPPKVYVTYEPAGVHLDWQAGGAKTVRGWVLQSRLNGVWHTEILPPGRTNCDFNEPAPEVFAVTAVGRAGTVSQPIAAARKRATQTVPLNHRQMI